MVVIGDKDWYDSLLRARKLEEWLKTYTGDMDRIEKAWQEATQRILKEEDGVLESARKTLETYYRLHGEPSRLTVGDRFRPD